ncbi:hypothetical protein SAMN04487982_103203 [Streptomyces sp. ok210]|nr:hypothetical protein SAMN04487982_103203 [Streptomyces sp. ok210]
MVVINRERAATDVTPATYFTHTSLTLHQRSPVATSIRFSKEIFQDAAARHSGAGVMFFPSRNCLAWYWQYPLA